MSKDQVGHVAGTPADAPRRSAPSCPYDDRAYSLDPDGLCLNCSDDRERDRIEMEGEIRQDAMMAAA